MIEFAKITGEVENNHIMVQIRTQETFLAPIAVMGTDVSVPSEDWIKNNKDKFLALVAYEKDIPENPFIIGFYPVRGADSSEYNTTERLLAMVLKLVEQLINAKVNTFLGPQPFMQDTIQVLNDIKDELNNISDLILPLKLQ